MHNTITIPIRTYSESNMNEHWRKKHKRKKDQQQAVRYFLLPHRTKLKLPLNVKLTRLAPRTLDDDNLIAAFKYIRDAIADVIVPGLQAGRADNVEGLTFHCSQEKSPVYGVLIKFDA